jgi:hypothetical protein
MAPLEAWLRTIPGAVFRLTHSALPPLGMLRKDLSYPYSPSSPAIIITQGPPDRLLGSGFLQSQVGHRYEGEFATSGGCWMHLSLEESEDGFTLSGSAWINIKASTRSCRSVLAKEVKKGQPFPSALARLR